MRYILTTILGALIAVAAYLGYEKYEDWKYGDRILQTIKAPTLLVNVYCNRDALVTGIDLTEQADGVVKYFMETPVEPDFFSQIMEIDPEDEDHLYCETTDAIVIQCETGRGIKGEDPVVYWTWTF